MRAELPPAFAAFARLFLDGDYRAANDVLEHHWQGCRSDFMKAFIQIAVAFYQAGRGRRAGALKLAAKARGLLDPYRPVYRGLDVERVARALDAWLASANAAGPGDPASAGAASAGASHPGGPVERALEEIRAALRPAAEGGRRHA